MTHVEKPQPREGLLTRLFWGPFSRLGLWTALIVFALDQSHKWWMLLIYKVEGKGRLAVTSFLDVVYVLNKGISYSMLKGDTANWQYALAAFAVVASLALAIWLARAVDNRVVATSVGLIIGGALGNALDRITLGGVADFFSLHAFGYYWYVFNIADVAIVGGVIGLLYDSFRDMRTESPKKDQVDQPHSAGPNTTT
jgi:signal peptidase II